MLILLKWESYLEHAGLKMPSTLPDMYGLFTLEPLHDFHLNESKTLKETALAPISSEKRFTKYE